METATQQATSQLEEVAQLKKQHSELDSSMDKLHEKIEQLGQQKAEAVQKLQTKTEQLKELQNDHSQKTEEIRAEKDKLTKDMEVLLSQNEELEKGVYLDSICSVFYQYTLAGIRLFHINSSC